MMNSSKKGAVQPGDLPVFSTAAGSLKYLILPLLLSACTVPIERVSHLTPDECITYGVAVQDGATPTGTIVSSQFGTYATTERECGGVYGYLYSGCVVAAEGLSVWPSPSGQYNIWYGEHKCAPQHEACHALYEEHNHTVSYNLRRMQGDKLAYCPASQNSLKDRIAQRG